MVMQALRRALLRDSVLLRLLPTSTEREDSGWGELLVEAFFADLPRQKESMADRIVVFLEDLQAASGSLTDRETISQRQSLFDATRLRDQAFVALVDGTTKDQYRKRIFDGFNTPLLPEVLICTSVGQEGIDLHRHCRNVIHYDLAWNPAVLEQRTGRADRIGSKTFREREVNADPHRGPFLEIGVPFLAGTYDERMFEELRLRAQMFEVLTGGDFAVENVEGRDDEPGAEGGEKNLSYVMLPDQMVADLRVSLHVWKEARLRS
jgi:superfamily II DNA/RNA helicase